jgi:hypothetical protein
MHRTHTSARLLVAALVAVLVLAGCGDDDDSDTDGAATEAVDEGGAADEALESEDLDIDNCTLLTDAEVSSLAGYDLEATEDGPLGCAWVVPGEVVGDFSIRSFRSEQSAAEHGAELGPSAEMIELDGIGDDAVALSVGGSVNFLVARDGDAFVELVMTFLDVTPDSPELERAGELANTALGRLDEAS